MDQILAKKKSAMANSNIKLETNIQTLDKLIVKHLEMDLAVESLKLQMERVSLLLRRWIELFR